MRPSFVIFSLRRLSTRNPRSPLAINRWLEMESLSQRLGFMTMGMFIIGATPPD
jgi:hypothetical protein